MKRLCSVCARGDSKGVPNKNIRPLLGNPLLIHSLDQARQSGLFDCIVVSSDSKEILQLAEEWGVDHAIERPEELATDIIMEEVWGFMERLGTQRYAGML